MDISKKEYYKNKSPYFTARTKNRLKQISQLGMSEIAFGQFGIDSIVSGLYIEMIWNYTNNEWKQYFDWLKSIVNNKI